MLDTEWQEIKIKYVAQICNGKEIVNEVELDTEGAIDVYGSGGVFKYTDRYLFNGEAVLFGRKGTIGKPMYANGKFWTVDTMFYVDCKNINTKLLYYIFKVFPWDLYTKTTTLPSIVGTDIANSKILIPKNEKEQKAIVSYLDKKLPKIEKVLDVLYEEINILETTKKAIVSECMTQGLRKDVVLKDSENMFCGKIAEDFECRQLRFLVKGHLQYGANEAGDVDLEDCPRYIRITDITSNNKLKEEGKQYLPWEIARPYLLKNGDVLFARSGATVGKTFYYEDKYGCAAYAGYLIKASSDESLILSKYLWYYTLSNNYELWKNNVFTQTTIQNIGADKYALLPVTFPLDINEQQEIVDYLDKKCGAIDRIIEVKTKQIEKLETHKMSMIYDYVTGAKKVGGTA